jgi:hypothetical protein
MGLRRDGNPRKIAAGADLAPIAGEMKKKPRQTVMMRQRASRRSIGSIAWTEPQRHDR